MFEATTSIKTNGFVTNEELACRREPKNIHDQYTVSVRKNDDLVGHVPQKVSTMCSLSLRKEG